jgi:hypothetical protein
MPDHRSHRGPHPEDADLFATPAHPALRSAAADLSWLLSRGYASPSALKVVGDRYALNARQRVAVARSSCADAARAARQSRLVPPEGVAAAPGGREMLLDGYNVLTTVEAALGGGVVLVGRDGAYRDMASMHGTYRGVEETVPALTLIGDALARFGVPSALWYLDAPVSNSGRLKGVILDVARRRGWAWQVQLVPDPDAILAECDGIAATADSAILDAPVRWFGLAGEVVRRDVPGAWVVDLSGT